MANYAALVDVLSIAGSRLSDGTPNASGTVWIMRPGTNTEVNAYSDAAATTIITQPITLTEGGTLNTSDFPNGIYVTQPVRLLVQDVDGATVVDTTYIPATAGDVGINNSGWTVTNLNDALTALWGSTGGQDGTYKESGGATERPIAVKFREGGISVADFGAVGDGVAIDTTSVQAAFNRAKALSCNVIVPAGTYLIDQAITMTDAEGVSVIGAGSAASVFRSTNASADCFTFDTCASLGMHGISITHATSSTGIAVSLTECSNPTFADVVHEGGTNSGFRYGLSLTGSDGATLIACTFEGESSSADARGLRATDSSRVNMFGGRLEAVTGHALEVAGQTSNCLFNGVGFSTRARFETGLSGSDFYFVACSGLELSVGTASFFPVIEQWQSPPYSSSVSGATGTSVTPTLVGGKVVQITASGGAGTLTVNDPALLPTTAGYGIQYWEFWFINNTGGACTYTLGSVYKVAAAIPTTAGHTVIVRFEWDGTFLREVSRADTTT